MAPFHENNKASKLPNPDQYNPSFQIEEREKVTLVSIVCDSFKFHQTEKETLRSLEELKSLLKTLKVSYSEQVHFQKKTKLDAGTILGSGKLLEICNLAKSEGCSTLVFDFQLSASQMRNIEEITKMKIVDRCNVIFQIFAEHARTREAKIQIEISRLQYMLPRLTALWTHFTRQKGGIGLKGEGEQQLELDRRIIKKKVAGYYKQLEEFKLSKQEQSKKRQEQVIIAALVGYTNAGKSSLMNRLCQVNVLEENKLFATLDATYRLLSPDSRPPVVLVDTVGLISNLPAPLIEGFKTTFASAQEADLLLIVSDGSDPDVMHHLQTTENTLEEMGLKDRPRFYIFNKKDLITDTLKIKLTMNRYQNSFLTSTLEKDNMLELRKKVIDYFISLQQQLDIFVPYEVGNIHALLKKMTNIVSHSSHEKGIFYRLRSPEAVLQRLNLKNFILSPEESKNFI